MFNPLHLLFRGGGGAQHCTKMKKQCEGLRRLNPKEFDAELLEKMTREGRVFVKCPRVVDKEAYKGEVLEYVRPIDEYAAEEWKGNVGGLWREIVEAECMAPLLSMKRGVRAGHVNRYGVTNIVSLMLACGVYECPNLLELHKKMEGVGEKNSVYKCAGQYELSREQRGKVRELCSRRGRSK